MGIKVSDLTILSATGPTPTIPVNKDRRGVFFQVDRTLTTEATKIVLPADSSVLAIRMFGSAVSNAGTAAAITLYIRDNTGVISTGSINAIANGGTTMLVQMSNLPNLESMPLQGDLKISAVYAESGTPSTAGGPWTFEVQFVR